VADAKSKVYDHLEQAGEINITPVKVEFETEQLKRKGTLQNIEYIELNPKAGDFVSTKLKVNHNHLCFGP
jgi:fatty acid-binding protein DegV